jgi:hypothetical protein
MIHAAFDCRIEVSEQTEEHPDGEVTVTRCDELMMFCAECALATDMNEIACAANCFEHGE